MSKVVTDEAGLLLDLLNTRPLVDGTPTDALQDGRAATRWLAENGLPHSLAEVAAARQVRNVIARVVRHEAPARTLQPFLEGVSQTPSITERGLHWELHTGPVDPFSLRCLLTWAHLEKTLPGRLRPCANEDCNLFLLDHSRANTRRWCSMAACGNRLKARRHHQRAAARTDSA